MDQFPSLPSLAVRGVLGGRKVLKVIMYVFFLKKKNCLNVVAILYSCVVHSTLVTWQGC